MANRHALVLMLYRAHPLLKASLIDGHDLLTKRHTRTLEETTANYSMGRNIRAGQITGQRKDADEGAALVSCIVRYNYHRTNAGLHVALRHGRQISQPDIKLLDGWIDGSYFPPFDVEEQCPNLIFSADSV